MEGLLPWIVPAIAVGLLGVALWLWLRVQQDPVALRLRFQGAQIGATNNRTYRKRKIDSVPVVRFRRDVDEQELETDGADVTVPSDEVNCATPPQQLHFQLNGYKVTYTSNTSQKPQTLRFQETSRPGSAEYQVVALQAWFELEYHVVFFVTTQAQDGTQEPDVWAVAIGDLLKNRTKD